MAQYRRRRDRLSKQLKGMLKMCSPSGRSKTTKFTPVAAASIFAVRTLYLRRSSSGPKIAAQNFVCSSMYGLKTG
jgi:hypothetical protein